MDNESPRKKFLNQKDALGDTALHVLVSRPVPSLSQDSSQNITNDDNKILEYLLDNGANPDITNNSGETAADITIRTGNAEATKIIARHKFKDFIAKRKQTDILRLAEPLERNGTIKNNRGQSR